MKKKTKSKKNSIYKFKELYKNKLKKYKKKIIKLENNF